MKAFIQNADHWLLFENPVEVLTARTSQENFQCLEAIALRQSASRRKGQNLWAVGFVSYEASNAFDDALKTHAPGPLPLLQFGLFKNVERASLPAPVQAGSLHHYQLGEWVPSVSRDEYVGAIASIKEHIAAGDTYQVNYTFRLNADFKGDPFAFFYDLAAAQQGGHGAYIETDDFVICSASPELFFELRDGTITSRPMKGTMPRGLTFSNDWKNREALKNSAKDRAENIMIVDMIRNDIGRVAEAGSVETLSRFDVEKYPTVWQMTSTVRGNLAPEPQNKECRISNHEVSGAGNVDAVSSPRQQCGEERDAQAITPAKVASTLGKLFSALFPCASITGAPKAKTMEIIQGLERTACGLSSPRGIYTGSIGFVAPDGAAQFNVAIRTAVIQDGKAEYGIGGGVVWDSDADAEYEEALSKAAILTKKMPGFQCLETMLWEHGEIFLLERHLKRLAESAEYFDFQFDREKIRQALDEVCRPDVSVRRAPGRDAGPTKIRLLLSQDGAVQTQTFHIKRDAQAITPAKVASALRLVVAKEPVNSGDVFLYHKTTNRGVYEKAKADFPDADDVLLFNERGEVTESGIANVVVELDGRKITPPVSCGLLAGTFRDELLEKGEIEERVVMLDEIKKAARVWTINSVRRWRQVKVE